MTYNKVVVTTFFGDFMKKIIFIIGCILIVVFIYIINNDKKVTYLEITDNYIVGDKSVKYLSSKNILDNYIYYKKDNNYRLIDLYNDINNNSQITFNKKKYNINNLFIKSKYIVLNIGHNDINYIKQSSIEPYTHIDSYINNYEKIIKLIRNISKENIIIIFDYNLTNKYNDYLYNKMKIVTNRYNCNILYKNELLNHIKDFTKNKK